MPLVAISPQMRSNLLEIQQRHTLDVTIATDRDNHLARQLGITFEATSATRQAATAPLGEVTGTGRWELRFPTALVIDRKSVVGWMDGAPDRMKRTEADAIIDAVGSTITEL